MRAVALIAALACASAAHADGVRESRYGPAPDRPPVPMNGQGPGFTGPTYGGQMLGWTGKRQIVEPEVQAQPVQQPWWAQQQQPAPQPAPRYAPQPQAQAYPQPQSQFQPQAPQYRQPEPQQQAYAPPQRALPQTIYDAPRAVVPVQTAYAEQTQAPAPRALAPGQVGARTYSVGRQFGMDPDPIPAAGPPRMVLIAPPATAPEDDKPRDDDDRDWPAKAKKDSDQ